MEDTPNNLVRLIPDSNLRRWQNLLGFGLSFFRKQSRTTVKGWIEVGNTEALVQYDLPDSNDVWYKFCFLTK